MTGYEGLIIFMTRSHFCLLNTKFLGGNAELQNRQHCGFQQSVKRQMKGFDEVKKHAHEELGTAEVLPVQPRKTPRKGTGSATR